MVNAELSLDLECLRSSLNKIMDKVIADHGRIIQVTESDYWCVDDDDKFKFTTTPDQLSVGNLGDDLKAIVLLIENEDEFFSGMLAHVVPLLSYANYYCNEHIKKSLTE